MNKLMIAIGMISGVYLPTANEIKRDGTQVSYEPRQLVWAIDNLQDIKGYIIEDMEEGRISEEYANNYWELLDETEGFIQDYNKKYKTNTIAKR
tara:strand:+ start:333 stop:614 length:282 start_codon:yes stop_codon:yes gene_type:complete